MAKGHEPKGMKAAQAYGQEPSTPGKSLVSRKTNRQSNRHSRRHGGRK
jgi:hypothetical protein